MAMIFWTHEEETRLVRELSDGLTIEDIATAHQRTPTAVLARLARMTPADLDLRTRTQRAEWLREQLLTEPDYDWAASLAATRRRQHEETRANASRAGKVWTQAEDEQLLAAVTAGVSIRDLAAQMQRSTKSTARRIYDLAQRDDETSSTEGPRTSATPSRQSMTQATAASTVSPTASNDTTIAPAAGATAAVTPAAAVGTSGPRAHGQPWSEEETFRMLEELRQGLLVADIAVAHHRSIRAINGRAATVLTHLTGSKHALSDSSADQLRTRLTQTVGATSRTVTSGTATSGTGPSEQDALDVLRAVLGATALDA